MPRNGKSYAEFLPVGMSRFHTQQAVGRFAPLLPPIYEGESPAAAGIASSVTALLPETTKYPLPTQRVFCNKKEERKMKKIEVKSLDLFLLYKANMKKKRGYLLSSYEVTG